MTTKQRKVSTLSGFSVVFLAAGFCLTGCNNPEEVNTTQEATGAATFNDADELFSAVDDQLDCPEGSSGSYYFMSTEGSDETRLRRSCADSIVMAWSTDKSTLGVISEMMTTADDTLAIVEAPHWFVVDISGRPTDSETAQLNHPASRDLESLAKSLNAKYTQN